MIKFLYAQRADGTFVIEHNRRPYHLIPGDKRYNFEQAQAQYAALNPKPAQEPAPPPQTSFDGSGA